MSCDPNMERACVRACSLARSHASDAIVAAITGVRRKPFSFVRGCCKRSVCSRGCSEFVSLFKATNSGGYDAESHTCPHSNDGYFSLIPDHSLAQSPAVQDLLSERVLSGGPTTNSRSSCRYSRCPSSENGSTRNRDYLEIAVGITSGPKES